MRRRWLHLTRVAILILGVGASARVAQAAEEYRLAGADHGVRVPISVVGGIRVNDVCAKEGERCLATRFYRGRSRLGELKTALPGNVPSAYCALAGGSPVFLARAGGEAEPFCVFPDLSIVDARAVYLKHLERGGAGAAEAAVLPGGAR